MQIKSVRLNEINLEDQRFRISEDLDSQPIRDSLSNIGQLNPVNLLVEEDAGMIIICGFRRLRALRRLEATDVMARLWPVGECTSLQGLSVALWDNLSHRRLNPLEIARVLSGLKETGLVDQILLERYLPILGLSPHPRILQDYLDLHQLRPGLRRLLMDGGTTVRNAIILAGEGEKLQVKMADLLRKVHLRASRQHAVFDLVRDLAAMRDQRPEDVLEHPEIRDAANDRSLSGAQRGEAVHRFLRREKNPRYVRAREGFESEKKKLDLPGSVRISPDPFFETSRLRIEFDVRTASDYREIVSALSRAAESSSLENLFRING